MFLGVSIEEFDKLENERFWDNKRLFDSVDFWWVKVGVWIDYKYLRRVDYST